jgi:atypical dual specificity phosphatase
MAPPSFSQAVDACRLVEQAIEEGAGVAIHCRGGLGRTGTGLAATLIWFGDDAAVAIAKVRDAQRQAIQTTAQERFLHDFAKRIRAWH